MAARPDSGILFQEELRNEPFWMMVACIMINQTHWRQVKPVLAALRARCDGPSDVVKMPVEGMTSLLKPLGFQNRKTSSIRCMAAAWTLRPPRNHSEVAKLPGCGPYAVQSYMIFVDGLEPERDAVTDHKLMWYLDRRAKA